MTKEIFEKIWKQYSELTPQAQKIHQLLEEQGEKVVNDHVAYRSVNLPGLGVNTLAQPFLDMGYEKKGDYEFEAKKLFAIHLEHKDRSLPKVFISELLLEKCSEKIQNFFKDTLKNISLPQGEDVLTCGRPWDLSYQDYESLYSESEYAAWFAAFGYCANHFTVYVNELENFEDLESLNEFLEKQGFTLNSSGGKIKGSEKDHLEQSSTLADEKEVEFSDQKAHVPSCYYEFARRYPLENGEIFQGFVAGSADKIFESTHKKS